MSVQSFRDLRVWQRSIELAAAAYAVARSLPREERAALGVQIRRASGSIPANIAEGHTRAHRKEFLQFLAIAHASLTELETHLILAHRLGYVTEAGNTLALALCDEVSRMLTAMRARLGDARLAATRHPSLDTPRRSTLDAPADAPKAG